MLCAAIPLVEQTVIGLSSMITTMHFGLWAYCV